MRHLTEAARTAFFLAVGGLALVSPAAGTQLEPFCRSLQKDRSKALGLSVGDILKDLARATLAPGTLAVPIARQLIVPRDARVRLLADGA